MDTITFQELYVAHARDVHRFARYLCGTDDAAADVTSETFLRAWVGRESIRGGTARAYLIAIARNLCHDRRRRARRWPEAAMPERAVRPDAEARLELDRTLDAVSALPERYREPLLLIASGIGYEEAGRVLGLPVSTVKIRVHRARLELAAAKPRAVGDHHAALR
jgi:RNA polymerase sigma-70 factor (ECF subfamily)